MPARKADRPPIYCRICGKMFRAITHKHTMQMHGIPLADYKRIYESAATPDVVLPPEVLPSEVLPSGTVEVSTPQTGGWSASPEHQTRVPIARGEIFDSLAEWITQDSQLTPLVHKVVETLLLDEGKRFSVVIRALAAAKLEKARDLLMKMDRVEHLLYDPMRLATATTDNLIRIKQLLDADMESTKQLLIHVAGETVPTVQNVHLSVEVDQRQVHVGGQPVQLPATGPERERLFRLAQQLRAMVKPATEEP